jgi:chloramphenicol-sensitive protein RarD
MAPAADDARQGAVALLAGYTLWGFLPIYLHALTFLPAPLIIAYRIVLCCGFVLLWLRVRGELGSVRAALVDPAVRWRLAVTALLITVNWLVYVWAVGQDRVVEASLGYFITPLLNVVMGVVFLRERLRRAQQAAVAFAAAGVLYLTLRTGSPPYIALSLALTFGTYGLMRKTVAVESLVGLAAETLIVTPLGAAYIVFAELRGEGAFSGASASQLGLLSLCGAATAVPLWLFSYGARRCSLATVGLISYLSPTLAMLVGLYWFHEHFDPLKLVGFACIWCGLILYSVDAVLSLRKQPIR